MNENALAAGRVSGVDPIEDISRRCIRIVGNIGAEVSGCVLCGYASVNMRQIWRIFT